MINFPAEALLSDHNNKCLCSWEQLIKEKVVPGANLKMNACGMLWRSAAFDFPQHKVWQEPCVGFKRQSFFLQV